MSSAKGLIVDIAPFGRRQLRPSQRGEILPGISDDIEKGLVGFDDPAVNIPDHNPDDVRVDQTADPSLPLPEIAVETGILERNRRLRCQHFQDRDPGGCEHVRCQIVLQIEHADQLGLFHQRQTEDRPSTLLADVLICRERILRRGVIKDHALARPGHGAEYGFGKLGRRRGRVAKRYLNLAAAGRRFRRDLWLVGREQDEQATRSTGMFDYNSQQRLDELSEDDLPGHRLRGLEHRPDIQPLDGRANGSGGKCRNWCVSEMRMKPFELPHLAVGSPTQISVAGVLQIHAGNLLEAMRRVEAGSEFIGERLMVNKAVGAGRADGLFVEAFGIELPAFEPRDLGADQRDAVREIIRAIRRPELELPLMRSDSVQALLSFAGWRGIPGGGLSQGAEEMVFRRFEL